jgi:hypothetical protein
MHRHNGHVIDAFDPLMGSIPTMPYHHHYGQESDMWMWPFVELL